MKALTIYKLLILTALGLFVSQGLLFLGQAAMLHHVPLAPKEIKVLIFLITLTGAIFLVTAQRHTSKEGLRLITLYFIFLLLNLLILAANNPRELWMLAFLYNYSLSIMILPLAIATQASERSQLAIDIRSARFKTALTIVLLITGIAFYESVQQYNIFQPWMDILRQNEVIKFGRIGEMIRPNSIFKSPIDFSYFNAIISGLILLIFFRTKSHTYFLIFLALSACQILILVRSGMVAYLAIVGVVFLTESSLKAKAAMFMLAAPAAGALLLGFHDQLLETVMNPTNLYIRLDNWSNLVNHLWESGNLLAGSGVVQNGNYGARNSVVIDNLYIGILFTGGILGLITFTLLVGWMHLRLSRSNDPLQNWKMASLMGLLCAGLFENTMHLMYMFIFPFFFTLAPIGSKSKRVSVYRKILIDRQEPIPAK